MADDEDPFANPLGVDDDEYDIVHEVPLVVARRVATLDEARDRARLLIEHGVGATVGPAATPTAPDAPDAGGTAGDGFEVRVLPTEAARATELLDAAGGAGTSGPASVAEPGAVSAWSGPASGPGAPGEGGDEAVEVEKVPVPWKTVLLIWVAAMIVIPATVGYGMYLLSR